MTGSGDSRLAWTRLDLGDSVDVATAAEASSAIVREIGLGARSFDLRWRTGGGEDARNLRTYVLRDAVGVAGLAMFSATRLPLKFAIGEVVFARVPLARQWHVGAPYLAARLSPAERSTASALLVRAALAELGAGECLFLEGLPVDDPLHAAVVDAAPERRSLSLQLCAPYEHQFIALPETFDEYVQQLGPRSRQSVLYSQRRVRKDMGGDVQCRCFETEADVDRFVTDAVEISRKTYQWNLLGLGLRDADGLRRSLGRAAVNGWFRSFILYCKGVPAAFMLGFQHENCYYYDDVGFDPAYAKWSVGTVLQIEVLEFLYGRADRPQHFDFSTGYGEHKGRFGNGSRRETNLLVLPATVRNRALVGAYRANDRLGATASALLARAGVKERLRRLIRARATQNADTPAG